MDQTKLETTLRQAEGVRNQMYDDATGLPIIGPGTIRGNATVGIGHNMCFPISDAVMNLMLQEDILKAHDGATFLFGQYFATWADARQRAIVEAIFNLGLSNFQQFHRTIAALRAERWVDAAAAIRDSRWFDELPTRVGRIARMVETGEG